jgi:hypothetical protein
LVVQVGGDEKDARVIWRGAALLVDSSIGMQQAAPGNGRAFAVLSFAPKRIQYGRSMNASRWVVHGRRLLPRDRTAIS